MKPILSILSCLTLLCISLVPQTVTATVDNSEIIEEMIANMTPKEKIGQLVMPDTYDLGQLPDAQTEQLIKDYHAGSIIIYGHYDAITTANYTNQLQTWAKEGPHRIPLFISADLEYGAVQHVTDATVFPRQMGIGATKDLAAAKKIAEITAKEAKAVGYNWNYSPVADVNVNPLNPVIGVRSFGEDLDLVTDMSLAMIEGHQENNVLATAKHFPGHGDTFIDSHFGMDRVTYDRKTLDEIHLAPFRAAIEAGVDSIMTSHIIIDAIDPELPATLSEKVLTGLLREDLGFDGLIITDAMDMGAITNNFGRGEAAVKAVLAGADILIAKGTHEQKLQTFEGLYEAYESGDLTIERIDASVKRILRKKLDYHLFDDPFVNPDEAKAIIDTPAHKQFATEVAQQSITLLKNNAILPFDETSKETTLIIGPKIYNTSASIDEIVAYTKGKVKGQVDYLVVSNDPSDVEIKEAIEKSRNADRIIVATFSASELPLGQAELVNALIDLDKALVALSLGLPYDIENYVEVDAYLATYAIERWGSPVPTAWNAAIDVIFGAEPGGSLPVSIAGYFDYGAGLTLEQKVTPTDNKQNGEKSSSLDADSPIVTGINDKDSAEKTKNSLYIFIGLIMVLLVILGVLSRKQNRK